MAIKALIASFIFLSLIVIPSQNPYIMYLLWESFV